MEYTMKNGTKYSIDIATESQWFDATELAFRVFLKYEAPVYGKEGTDKFAEFLASSNLRKMFNAGYYKVFVAAIGNEIIGVGSFRSGNHISLLFVDDRYHRQGIGAELIKSIQNAILEEGSYEKMTVNASPYGEPFYEKVGFVAYDSMQKADGITYRPMEMYI